MANNGVVDVMISQKTLAVQYMNDYDMNGEDADYDNDDLFQDIDV